MKTVGVADYTNYVSLSISNGNMSKLKTCQNLENIHEMRTKREVHIFNV